MQLEIIPFQMSTMVVLFPIVQQEVVLSAEVRQRRPPWPMPLVANSRGNTKVLIKSIVVFKKKFKFKFLNKDSIYIYILLVNKLELGQHWAKPLFTHCGLVTPYGDTDLFKFGSGNGLLPDGSKPLPEPLPDLSSKIFCGIHPRAIS